VLGNLFIVAAAERVGFGCSWTSTIPPTLRLIERIEGPQDGLALTDDLWQRLSLLLPCWTLARLKLYHLMDCPIAALPPIIDPVDHCPKFRNVFVLSQNFNERAEILKALILPCQVNGSAFQSICEDTLE
jgi:hypothetical protein